MADLQYSLESRNVLNRFHGVEKILFVEGDDDIPFWEIIFQAVGGPSIKIEECGGKENLAARMEEVQGGKANYLVAIDADFDVLMEKVAHQQIIRTMGYSIENTIVSALALQRVICRVGKVSKKTMTLNPCIQWLSNLEVETRQLVVLDAINRIDGLGHAVLGENCDRFMASKKSGDLCAAKVKAHIDSLPIAVNGDHLELVEGYVTRSNVTWVDMLRGHFLMSLAYRFIKAAISKLRGDVSISRDIFFGSLTLAFESTFDARHPHYEYYRDAVTQTVANAG